ncbi:MAG: hypothetical protein R3D55_06740 [Chloroflexota bacterium]
MSLLFALASVGVLWFWGFKYKNFLFLMLVALIISSRNFVINAISITEWSLTLLIASSYFVWFFTKYNAPRLKQMDILILFGIGFLGSITRSDFGLLPFATFLTTLIFFSTLKKQQLLLAFAGFMGTSIGLLAAFAHNYLFTNEFLQSSAKMKAYWSQLWTPNYYAVPLLIGSLIGIVGLLLFALLIGTAILPRFANSKRSLSNINKPAGSISSKQNLLPGKSKTHELAERKLLFMLTSAGICIAGYTLFYSRNGDVQPWYTANLILPVLMIIFAISDYMTAALQHKAKFVFATLFLLALIFNITRLYPLSTDKAPWPHQEFMFEAGTYLAENQFNCKIGAWNAGIIGYFEGGNVVNLDGLVNNDIYSYATANNLPAYISEKNICYIVDFENMIAIHDLRIRGGYDDTQFVTSLVPELVFDQGQFGWQHLTLYRVP